MEDGSKRLQRPRDSERFTSPEEFKQSAYFEIDLGHEVTNWLACEFMEQNKYYPSLSQVKEGIIEESQE